MKRILINLKDWLDRQENVDFASNIDGLDVTVYPSLPYLYIYENKNVKLGSQKISSYPEGAHTGSISAKHLKDFGVSSVILNHKECQISDAGTLIKKIQNAREENIEVILCIASTTQCELDKIKDVLKCTGTKKIALAYEPEKLLSTSDIIENLQIIRSFLKDFSLSYIYGTNVTINNIEEYNKKLEVDGYLISSNALNVQNLKTIIELTK